MTGNNKTGGAMSDSREGTSRGAGNDRNGVAGGGTPTGVASIHEGAGETSQLTEYAFRLAIERVVREGIVAWDLEGRQTYVSDAFCELLGWTEEELVGARPPFVYWPREEADQVGRAFRRILEGNAPSDGITLRFQRSDGERLDVLVASTALVADDGSTQGRLASVLQIPETRRGDGTPASNAEYVRSPRAGFQRSRDASRN